MTLRDEFHVLDDLSLLLTLFTNIVLTSTLEALHDHSQHYLGKQCREYGLSRTLISHTEICVPEPFDRSHHASDFESSTPNHRPQFGHSPL